jgi:hypothetical protein
VDGVAAAPDPATAPAYDKAYREYLKYLHTLKDLYV